MIGRFLVVGLMFALAACGEQPEGEPAVRADLGESAPLPEAENIAVGEAEVPEIEVVSACRRTVFEQVPLTHCVADPSDHRIRTDLGPGLDGAPYRSLRALAQNTDAETVAFAVNGGMYDDDGQPIGYYVERSERQKQLSLADGPGNFYLKPNGVFYGSGGSWRIRTSGDFFTNVRDRPEFGTQSGPMLVIDGELHPEIQDNGPSRAIRNGVGIGSDGKAHFVRSEEPLSFGQLARFYRDELKTPNALFLDGNVSALWDPATDRLDGRTGLGPLIVVTNR